MALPPLQAEEGEIRSRRMTLVIGLLIPLLGIMIGAAFVFLMRDEMSPHLQKTLLVFASGVMVANARL